MAKRALLIGCNYPGTNASLRGCINDAMGMRTLLVDCFGFSPSGIELMLDTDPSTTQPTGANIKAKLQQLVSASAPGDVLFVHFSGHGTQVPDDDETDGYDEAICPTDMNVITDDDLRDIFSKLAQGVKLTMIADCCHSGTLLDHEAVVIAGPKQGEAVPDLGSMLGSLLAGAMAGGGSSGQRDVVNRALPTNKLLDLLSSKLGTHVGKGNIRSSLVSLFGSSSSSKATKYLQMAQQASSVLSAAKKGNYSGALKMASSLFSGKPSGGSTGGSGSSGGGTAHSLFGGGGGGGGAGGRGEQKLGPDVGILITGCQAHETSADACPSGNPNQAFGALSNGIQTVLRAHFQQHPGQPISYRTLVTSVREALGQAKFAQNPCLECSPHNADTNFILH